MGKVWERTREVLPHYSEQAWFLVIMGCDQNVFFAGLR